MRDRVGLVAEHGQRTTIVTLGWIVVVLSFVDVQDDGRRSEAAG
jgi:hypothetical protein